jgi:phospholipid transport system transporter-binding protein
VSLAQLGIAQNVAQVSGNIDHHSVLALINTGQQHIVSASHADVIFDWSRVTHANSAALALILHWLRLAQSHNKNIIHQNAPEFLIALARLSQLEFLFQSTTRA